MIQSVKENQADVSTVASCPKIPDDLRLELKDDETTQVLELPFTVMRAVKIVLAELGLGDALTTETIHAELTTRQAADVLNVTETYMAKLLDEGTVVSSGLGTDRRVVFQDLLFYKQDLLIKTHAALDELTALGQEIGVGY